MIMISEYTDDNNRCSRVYKSNNGDYQVNFWDAIMEHDEWKPYLTIDDAEDAAEDWVLRK